LLTSISLFTQLLSQLLSQLKQLENLGDVGESPAGTVLYSGPTPKNLCLSKSCHDSGLDTALAAKMTADAIAEAHAGDANVQP
jgi:hypothetical protein